MNAARHLTDDGRPLYLAKDPIIQASSCIRVMTRQEFETSWRYAMSYFQVQHIVVTNEDIAKIKFDVEGLDTVFPSSINCFGWCIMLDAPPLD